MSALDGFSHRLRVLVRGKAYSREIQRELRFHLDLERQARASGGADSVAAEMEARRSLGNATYYREERRRMTLLHWVDRLRQDATYAMRGLRRSPGFTATVVVTLALGFGVNAAMYSMLDQIFRRPPEGVIRPNEIRRFYQDLARPKEPGGRLSFPFFAYPHYRALTAAVAPVPIAAFTEADSVIVEDGASRVPAREANVAGGYFSILGVRPQLGRFFVAEEDHIETPTPVAVISDAFWRRAFNADPKVLGRSIVVDHHRVTVVGIAPKNFRGIDLDVEDVWLPANMIETSSGARGPWYNSFGSSLRIITRLRTPHDEAQIAAVGAAALHGVHIVGFEYDSTARIALGSIVEASGPAKRAMEVTVATRISWIAIIVLVIACANVTNLLLLRAARRKREIAVRRALGVSTGRLYEQLAIESTLLAVLAGAAALGISLWVGSALRRLVMPNTHWAAPAVDARTALFLLGLSLLIGLGTGLVPAFQATRPELADSLKAGTRESAYQRSRLRSALLIAQATLCVMLLVGAGLFRRSLGNMQSIDVGYQVDFITLVTPVFATAGRHETELASSMPIAAERVSHVDGVEAVAYAINGPMRGMAYRSLFLPDRDSLPKLATDFGPSLNAVSPDYFRAAGVPLRAGRAFTRADGPGRAVIVNETMARLYWPGTTAIGKCIILDKRTNPCSPVVGVAANVHRMSILEEPTLQAYLPVEGAFWSPRTLIIRTRRGRAPAVAHAAEGILMQTVPGIDGVRSRAMSDVLEPELRPWILGATLFGAFGALALIVAGVGIYSVVAYGVSQRTNEMGVRVALGARTADIVDLVVGEGIRLLAIGVGLGVLVSLVLGRFIASLLFGITPYDASVLIGAAAVLCGLGLLACAIPGWRAARVDPVSALRAD